MEGSILLQHPQRGRYRVSQKNAHSECCWSYSALAQSEVASIQCVWKLILRSFLTKTKPDQAFPSHLSPRALKFGYDFVLLVHFFWDTLYVLK